MVNYDRVTSFVVNHHTDIFSLDSLTLELTIDGNKSGQCFLPIAGEGVSGSDSVFTHPSIKGIGDIDKYVQSLYNFMIKEK